MRSGNEWSGGGGRRGSGEETARVGGLESWSGRGRRQEGGGRWRVGEVEKWIDKMRTSSGLPLVVALYANPYALALLQGSVSSGVWRSLEFVSRERGVSTGQSEGE